MCAHICVSVLQVVNNQRVTATTTCNIFSNQLVICCPKSDYLLLVLDTCVSSYVLSTGKCCTLHVRTSNVLPLVNVYSDIRIFRFFMRKHEWQSAIILAILAEWYASWINSHACMLPRSDIYIYIYTYIRAFVLIYCIWQCAKNINSFRIWVKLNGKFNYLELTEVNSTKSLNQKRVSS